MSFVDKTGQRKYIILCIEARLRRSDVHWEEVTYIEKKWRTLRRSDVHWEGVTYIEKEWHF